MINIFAFRKGSTLFGRLTGKWNIIDSSLSLLRNVFFINYYQLYSFLLNPLKPLLIYFTVYVLFKTQYAQGPHGWFALPLARKPSLWNLAGTTESFLWAVWCSLVLWPNQGWNLPLTQSMLGYTSLNRMSGLQNGWMYGFLTGTQACSCSIWEMHKLGKRTTSNLPHHHHHPHPHIHHTH